jgi:hypothetical protein
LNNFRKNAMTRVANGHPGGYRYFRQAQQPTNAVMEGTKDESMVFTGVRHAGGVFADGRAGQIGGG